MKGLLHSKRFKENLYRWLFMYVGVIALLTTVITYSKYVTRLIPTEEKALPAKFDVEISNTDSAGNDCTKVECVTTGIYRPTSEIKYYFKFKADLEVSAEILLLVRINEAYRDDFKIVSVKESKVNGFETVTNDSTNNPESIYRVKLENEQDSITGEYKPIEKVYEVTVQYKDLDSFNSKTDSNDFLEAKNVLEVGYTAEQKNN